MHVPLLQDINKERKMNDGKNSLSYERRVVGTNDQHHIIGKAESIGIYYLGTMIGEPYATFVLWRDRRDQGMQEDVLLSW